MTTLNKVKKTLKTKQNKLLKKMNKNVQGLKMKIEQFKITTEGILEMGNLGK